MLSIHYYDNLLTWSPHWHYMLKCKYVSSIIRFVCFVRAAVSSRAYSDNNSKLKLLLIQHSKHLPTTSPRIRHDLLHSSNAANMNKVEKYFLVNF